MADHYESVGDLPVNIAVFPLTGALLFPRWSLPLNIFEPRYLKMLSDALATDRIHPVHFDAVDVLHHQEVGTPVLAGIGGADDVGVIQTGDDFGLIFKMFYEVGI